MIFLATSKLIHPYQSKIMIIFNCQRIFNCLFRLSKIPPNGGHPPLIHWLSIGTPVSANNFLFAGRISANIFYVPILCTFFFYITTLPISGGVGILTPLIQNDKIDLENVIITEDLYTTPMTLLTQRPPRTPGQIPLNPSSKQQGIIDGKSWGFRLIPARVVVKVV